MTKTIGIATRHNTNSFGQMETKGFEEVKYTGTPAELAELVKTESYVFLAMPKQLKANSALMEELAALNLLPARMDWESNETYFDGFNLIVYDHGEAQGRELRDFVERSPIFCFDGIEG